MAANIPDTSVKIYKRYKGAEPGDVILLRQKGEIWWIILYIDDILNIEDSHCYGPEYGKKVFTSTKWLQNEHDATTCYSIPEEFYTDEEWPMEIIKKKATANDWEKIKFAYSIL